MSRERVDHVVIGEVVLAARADGLETAEAIGIGAGRVVAAGHRRDVLDAALPGARITDATGFAVVPGIHDFHLHLVGMARARRAVRLDDATSFESLVERVRDSSRSLPPGAWLTGRGWHEDALDPAGLGRLEAAVGDRPAALSSHDGHSLWASATARAVAGIDLAAADPPGGRVERDAHGAPNGILREAAMGPVDAVKERLHGAALWTALDETLAELAGLGITGVTDAGDSDAVGGSGELAALGDSFSTLTNLAARMDGRLRLTVNLPAAAIGVAAERGLRSGAPPTAVEALHGAELPARPPMLRVGWAKLYSDGALGSRTAALFAPHTCGDAPDAGILRHEPGELGQIVRAARRAGIGMAIHAIGDRAVATALDALASSAPRGAVPDRIEHAQLVRPRDRERFARAGVTASLQPIHAASDRDAIESCWAGRQAHAYPWRSLSDSGARLAFGSDAPIETVNPWHGLFAAVRRHAPGDGRGPWRVAEAIGVDLALSAYTLGPASALSRGDEGHLRPGAHADLAVLDVDLRTLREVDERAARIGSQLTLVGGRAVDRA